MINLLKKECIEYVEWLNTNQSLYMKNYPIVQKNCQIFDSMISNAEYQRLQENFTRQEDGSEKCSDELSKEDIINLTLEFFEQVSPELRDQFVADLKKGMVNIAKGNKNKCYYCTKTVNGKKENFSRVTINYTGTIVDVIILSHEYFHALSDVDEYRDTIDLNKFAIDYIQEMVSILAEMTCIKYFSEKYPTECYDRLCNRIFGEVYISAANGNHVFSYVNMILKGCNLEDLENKFDNISGIRKFIQDKKTPFSIEHFIGTTSSISSVATAENPLALLNSVYEEIRNKNFEKVVEIAPMKCNPLCVAEVAKNGFGNNDTVKK